MDKEKILLQVDQLSTEFTNGAETNTVVKKISFDLFKGEILGVVGESGSGKSVTVYSILQLLPTGIGRISNGRITFVDQGEGIDLQSLDESEIRKYRGRKIAMIFQEPLNALNPSMRCGQQVMEMIDLHTDLGREAGKAKILSLFEKTKLNDPGRVYQAYPHELSGGQIQRVVIAMALAADPEILIADEPTTALDVTVQKEIIELIVELKDEFNSGIIFISHDLDLVAKIADRLIVMKDGQIIESGNSQSVFANPQKQYTKELILSNPKYHFGKSRLPDFNVDGSLVQHNKNRTSPTDVSVLTCTNLSLKYPKTRHFFGKVKSWITAVDDLSFQLFQGEILGVVGESGSGKSSLAKLITRQVDSSNGTILHYDKDLSQLSKKELKEYRMQCQMVFQDPYSSLNPKIKIGEAILEPIVFHKLRASKSASKDRVYELLDLVGLDRSHYDRYPHQFSGGQRQRIVIARALALEPKILVCDECTSALDVTIQAQIINLLLDLRDELNLSIVFISHDLSVIRFMSDRILVMYQGKIVERGNADQVYEQPQESYTKKLIEAIL